MDVLHHEPEKVLVPLKDEVPQVSLEEVLCAVEEGSRGLHWKVDNQSTLKGDGNFYLGQV